MMAELGAEDYREGALLRLKEAQELYAHNQWVGSIYLAGRAVESLLRSLLWAKSRQQEIGHNLREMLERVFTFGLFSEPDRLKLNDAVNELAIIWRNDLRFTGEKRFRRILKDSGRLSRIGSDRIKGDPVKANAHSAVNACEAIISRGEPICRRYSKN